MPMSSSVFAMALRPAPPMPIRWTRREDPLLRAVPATNAYSSWLLPGLAAIIQIRLTSVPLDQKCRSTAGYAVLLQYTADMDRLGVGAAIL